MSSCASIDCTFLEQVLAEVQTLNERADIDGIVVQMPLPNGVDSEKVFHVFIAS